MAIQPGCTVARPLFKNGRTKNSTPTSTVYDFPTIYADATILFDKLNEDPQAGIALFRLASSCPQNVATLPPGCPSLDISRVIRKDKIDLLEISAKLGSDVAKLMYAMNAPIVALRFKEGSNSENQIYSHQIMAQAETFGIEAAQSGLPDALRFMSRAYEDGLFGRRDQELAYAYSLPLRSIGKVSDIKRIEDFERSLSTSEKSAAMKYAFGCEAASDSGILISPF